MSTVLKYVHRMTVGDISHSVRNYSLFFHKNQEWKENANIDISKYKQKMRNEE